MVRFVTGDIAAWRGEERFEVILANASLQWVPDHATLLPALVARLAPGGSLAVQMTRTGRYDCARYGRILRDCCATVGIWRTSDHPPLPGADAVMEWFEGSGLLACLQRLDAGEQADFLARYRDAVAHA